MRRVIGVYREAFSGLPRDLRLLAVVALVNRSGSMVLPFISLYLTSARGFAPHEAGELVALYGVGAGGGAYLGGWLADRFGAIRAQQTSLFSAARATSASAQSREGGRSQWRSSSRARSWSRFAPR